MSTSPQRGHFFPGQPLGIRDAFEGDPYPRRRKPCNKTPPAAISSVVPPSQQRWAQTSPGSHHGTNLPGTFCGAWWVHRPLRWSCWMGGWVGDGRPESYWRSWWRRRAGLGSRFPLIHFLHKLMLWKDLRFSDLCYREVLLSSAVWLTSVYILVEQIDTLSSLTHPPTSKNPSRLWASEA